MRYILYCRKSTPGADKKNKQALSIPAQKRELLAYAKQRDLNIVEQYSECRSAQSLGRPEFGKMMSDFEKGKADGILCWHPNRLARNMVDGGRILGLLQTGVISKISTPDQEYLPKDPIWSLLFAFGESTQSSKDLSKNVLRGNKQKLIEGGWPSMAPIGYLNDKAEKTIILDPDRYMFIKSIFEEYATGCTSIKDISNKLYLRGLRTKAGKAEGKKVHKSKIHVILRNPFYYGMMESHGRMYRGNHSPIISKSLFDKCQDILDKKSKPRRQKHNFIFVGLCICEECGCAITAEYQRGHSYYHCTNGKNICSQRKNYLRGHVLEKMLTDTLFASKWLNKEVINCLYYSARDDCKKFNRENEEKISILQKKVAELKERKSRLLDTYLSEKIEEPLFDNKDAEIDNEIVLSEDELLNLRNIDQAHSTIEQTKNVLDLFVYNKKHYFDLNDERKRLVLFKTLLNVSIKDRKVINLQYRSPYTRLISTPEKPIFSILCSWWDDVRTWIENNHDQNSEKETGCM